MIVIREAEIASYGTTLKVESQDRIVKGDYFKVANSDKSYYFETIRLKAVGFDPYTTEATLTQIGFSNHINKEPNFDVRDLINSDLVKVTDEEELKNIFKKGETNG